MKRARIVNHVFDLKIQEIVSLVKTFINVRAVNFALTAVFAKIVCAAESATTVSGVLIRRNAKIASIAKIAKIALIASD
jgi:hypothetical protein